MLKIERAQRRLCSLALTFVMLVAMCSVSHAAEANSASGFYSVSGTQILNGEGEAVVMKGISFGNMNFGNPSSTAVIGEIGVRNDHDAARYLELAAMGIDHVRFEFNYGLFEDDTDPYTYKEEGFRWLDENIAWARTAGIKLILQMKHPQGGYQSSTNVWTGLYSGGKALWIDLDENGNVLSTDNYKVNQERLVKLWAEIAARYKDEPTIIGYGLLNEPAVPEKDTKDATVAQWKDLAQRIADEIRAVDTNHMLFVECLCSWFKPGDYNGTNWDLLEVTDQQFLINDSNTVYEFHFYEPLKYTHQGANWLMTTYGDCYYDGVSVAELEISDWNGKGTSEISATNADGEWTYFESKPFAVTDTYNVAQPQVFIGELAARSSIWVDDIVIRRKDAAGNETVVLSCDFSEDEEGFFKVWNGRDDYGALEWDSAVGHGDGGSLKITNTLSVTANQWANAQSSDTIILEKGYTYTVSGYVRNGTTVHCPRVQFLYADKAWMMNKEYLAYKLSEYLSFGTENNVPLHVGEWGFMNNCYDKGAVDYARDLTALFAENQLSSNYHSYRDVNNGLYLSEEYQAQPERNETLYNILTQYYCMPVETTPLIQICDVSEDEVSIWVQGAEAAHIYVAFYSNDGQLLSLAESSLKNESGALTLVMDTRSGAELKVFLLDAETEAPLASCDRKPLNKSE